MAETQLDRIERRVTSMDDRLRAVELRLAKDDGAKGVIERDSGRRHAVLREFVQPLVTSVLAAGGTVVAAFHLFPGATR